MPKFSLERTVNADRDTVFEILSNFENYQRLVPQHFPSVRVRSVRGSISVVEEHMVLGDAELLIMAKHVISEAPTMHEIFVIGGDAKGSHIKQQFVELDKGTKVLVDVDLKLRGRLKISSMFGRNSFKQDYNKLLDGFVKIAEDA